MGVLVGICVCQGVLSFSIKGHVFSTYYLIYGCVCVEGAGVRSRSVTWYMSVRVCVSFAVSYNRTYYFFEEPKLPRLITVFNV